MSNRIRQLSQASYFLGSDELKEIMDYLNGPSMADILLENARNQTLREQYKQATENGTEASVGPMLASIKQLDR
jgi:hypothetical protein